MCETKQNHSQCEDIDLFPKIFSMGDYLRCHVALRPNKIAEIRTFS